MVQHSNKLVIASYNCKNLKSSVPEIQALCDTCDIVLLQETWLTKSDLPLLSQLHPDFYAKGCSSMDTDNTTLTGRPFGGLGILWRRTLGVSCKPIEYSDSRLLGLEFTLSDMKLLFINLYLPHCCLDNLDEYLHYLTMLDSCIVNSNTPYVFAMGDFNADISVDNSGIFKQRFGKELTQFCQEEQLIISDKVHLDGINGVYTYLSDSHNSTSWLDHLVCTTSAHKLVDHISINYSMVTSDHLPLIAHINLPDTYQSANCVHSEEVTPRFRIQWDKLTTEDLKLYKSKTEITLSAVQFEHGLALCDNLNCKDPCHINAIDRLYNSIISALHDASADFSTCQSQSFNQLPGWNDCCQLLHAEARDAFLTWRAHNSPRHGPIYNDMRCKRAHFKYTLRKCKSESDRRVADSLAKKLLAKDSKQFWKEVKNLNNANVSVSATSVGGVTGKSSICDMWQQHFKALLNSSSCLSMKNTVLNKIDKVCDNYILYSPQDIKEAIKSLKTGKAAGKDGLAGENFKYAHERLYVLLTLCFNSMIAHGYIAEGVMESIIIPLVKDKKGDITDKDNYRPIAITAVSSKILENLLLLRYRSQLDTVHNQFSFKGKHSTDLCSFVLKETIDNYLSHSSPVYVCFLDSSKAFDRVNHWYLFNKLLERGIPNIIVRLLSYWYSMQLFTVQWGNVMSTPFKGSNGVRQGGILSPLLFNVFMDDLSKLLNNSQVGCCLNGVFVNHLLYADDTVLLAPSPAALQKLVALCETYALDKDILYNYKKTVCMVMLPKTLKKLSVPSISLYNRSICWVKEHKYLGVFICNDFNDDRDLRRQMCSIYAKGNILIQKFRKCSVEVKTQLFNSYCTTLYCAQLWASYTSHEYQRLKVAYNNIFRGLMGIKRGESISKVFVENNVHGFNSLMRKVIYGFSKRIYDSSNELVMRCTQGSFFIYESRLNAKWHSLLY